VRRRDGALDLGRRFHLDQLHADVGELVVVAAMVAFLQDHLVLHAGDASEMRPASSSRSCGRHTQDKGIDTVLTRRCIAKQFRVTERDMRQIEEEGLEGEWPPL
jgi:hypothetical protein